MKVSAVYHDLKGYQLTFIVRRLFPKPADLAGDNVTIVIVIVLHIGRHIVLHFAAFPIWVIV